MKEKIAGRDFTQIFDDIAGEICDNYCKHLSEHMADDDDGETLMSEHCNSCPLNRQYIEVKEVKKDD